MLLARLFMQLMKHSDFDFKVTYLVMNPGYNEANINLIKENLTKLSIPAEIVESDIFEIKFPKILTIFFEIGKDINNLNLDISLEDPAHRGVLCVEYIFEVG